MAIISNKTNYIVLFISVIFLVLAGNINSRYTQPKIEIDKQVSAININTKVLKLFSAGQNRLLADIFWIATLIESDLKHYKKNDKNSWMYHRFNTISVLDPMFLQAYQFGGKYLGMIKDDIIGAKSIFEKGLIHYPSNYELLFNYGFLLAFELAEYEKAYKIYQQLYHYPQAPEFIKTLNAKILLAHTNNKEHVFLMLKSIYESEPKESPIRAKLWHDMYSLKAEIDLNCLNTNQIECNSTDLNGDRYVKEAEVYTSKTKFIPYKFNLKK